MKNNLYSNKTATGFNRWMLLTSCIMIGLFSTISVNAIGMRSMAVAPVLCDSANFTYSSATPFSVTVGTKDATDPFFGQGSTNTYIINGVQGAELTLMIGITYTFSISGTGHSFYCLLYTSDAADE